MRTLRRGVAVLTIAEAGLLLVLGVAPLLLLDTGDSPIGWVLDSARADWPGDCADWLTPIYRLSV